MIVEELRTLVTAQIADFQSKMSVVNSTIESVEAKSSAAKSSIGEVVNVRGDETAKSVVRVKTALEQAAEVARRFRRPFSKEAMQGNDYAEIIEKQKAKLKQLVQARDQAAEKQAANIDNLREKNDLAMAAVERQVQIVNELKEKLADIGTGKTDLGSMKKLQEEFERTAKSAEPIQRELDKLMEKYNETEERIKGLKLYNPEGSRIVQEQVQALAQIEKSMQPYTDELRKIDVRLEQIIAKQKSLKNNPLQSVEAEKLAEQIDAATAKLDALKLKAEQAGTNLNNAMNADNIAKYNAQISATQAELSAAQENAKGFAATMSTVMATISKFAMIFFAIQTVINLVVRSVNFVRDRINKMMEEFKKTLQTIGNIIGKIFYEAGKAALNTAHNIGKGFMNILRSYFGGIRNLIGRLADFAFIKPILGEVQAMIDGVSGSINGMASQFSLFGSALNATRQNALQLRGAFASMWQPLVNAALPAINTVLSAVTSLFNTISQLIASITGQEYALVSVGGITAADVENMNAGAEATKKNREEKEKYKQVLAGFDQLTILNFGKNDKEEEPEETGTGGGGGGITEGPIFQKVPVKPRVITDWMKFGKELAAKLVSAIGKIDAKEIGTKIGQTLQKAFDFAYGFLHTFKYNRLGNKVADILNHTMKNLDFKVVGATFAEGLNTIFRMGLDFVTTFEWDTFASKVGSGLYSFFANIEWDKIRDFFKEGVNGIITFGLKLFEDPNPWRDIPKVIGKNFEDMILGINWDGLGEMIGKGFNSVITALHNFLASVNWFDLGVKITGGINKAIETTDWPGLGSTIAKGFNSVLGFLHGVISEFEWGKAGKSLFDMINSFLADVNWEGLGNFLADLFTGVCDFITTGLNNFKWEEFKENVYTLLDTFLKKVDWENLGANLKTSFDNALENFKELLGDARWDEIGAKVQEMLELIPWDSIMEIVTSAIGRIFKEKLKKKLTPSDEMDWVPGQHGFGDGPAPYDGANSVLPGASTVNPDIGALLQADKGNVSQPRSYNKNKMNAQMFAQGGVFEPNKPLLGILGDNTSEREIAAPESTLKATFREALREGGYGGGQLEALMPIQLIVDGRIVDEYVERRQLRKARQLNKPAYGGA